MCSASIENSVDRHMVYRRRGKVDKMSNNRPSVVDFSSYSLFNRKPEDVSTTSWSHDDIKPLADDILTAFQDGGGVGLCYLKNHGLSQAEVDVVFELFEQFFSLPLEIKRKFSRTKEMSAHGWVEASTEIFDSTKPIERKEAYLVWPTKASFWPDKYVPGFTKGVEDLMLDLHELTYRVFDVLTVALGLEDTGFLRQCHANLMDHNGIFRCNLYPGIPDGETVDPNQGRFGEHSDFGSLALLIQDTTGGLQYKTAEGVWRSAPMVPGTVIVLVGDLLQRWSSDRLLAPVHRVVIPTEGPERHNARKSLVCFSSPPHDLEVRCIDGSDKYKPILVKDWSFVRHDDITKL